MKRLLLLLPLLLAAPVSAQVDPAVHKLCSDVKDYAGCVKTQLSISETNYPASNPVPKSKLPETNEWQKHLEKNPGLKAWAEANPSLGEKKKQIFFNRLNDCGSWNNQKLCLEYSRNSMRFTRASEDSVFLERKRLACIADDNKTWKNSECHDKIATHENLFTKPLNLGNVCPPGTRQYQKTALFGLVKGRKLCLSDYEAESLRQAQVQNAITNMNHNLNQNLNRNRIINCTSSSYGSYMSTTCY